MDRIGTGMLDDGITASLAALIRVRPDRRATGFAPGGRVRTHQFGTKRSVYRGRGIEFEEARIYRPGDDVRAIDWRVTARTGQLHTKLFHEERERPVLILTDLRSPMQFGTRVQFKSVLAAIIAAELAWVGIDGGDRVGGFILTPEGTESFPARRNTSAMLRLLKGLSEGTRPVGGGTDEMPLHSAVERLHAVCRPGTLVFIVSDFADFNKAAERAIKRLARHAHVTNILVYDPLDTMLPHGGQRISDGARITLLSSLSRGTLRAYERAFAERRDRLAKISRQRRMAYLEIPTTASAREALVPHRKGAGTRARQTRTAA